MNTLSILKALCAAKVLCKVQRWLVAQMKGYNIPMKNSTLVYGKDYPYR